MTRYAYYDSTVPSPSPVLGWYDTEARPMLNLVPVTDDQWNNRSHGYFAVSAGRLAPYDPPPTNQWQVQLAQHLALGLILTSTGTPTLDATYAIDSISQQQVLQIGLYASQFDQFPDGNSTFDYPDVAGNQHTFSVADFIALLHAVAQLTAAINAQAQIMKNGGTPVWPVNTVTIG